MKHLKFTEHKIVRSCDKELSPYNKYRPYLEKDFSKRCCYCNMLDELVTVPFHVEHFIPKKVFEGKKDFLLTKYDNLMWACPKCNLSKSDAYKGDLENDDSITNQLFYNPVEVNYNSIFYRNRFGEIKSDDEKGKDMIKRLKLYRPVHSVAWLLERMERMTFRLDEQIKEETVPEKKEMLENAKGKIAFECLKMERQFRAVYNGKQFAEHEE